MGSCSSPAKQRASFSFRLNDQYEASIAIPHHSPVVLILVDVIGVHSSPSDETILTSLGTFSRRCRPHVVVTLGSSSF